LGEHQIRIIVEAAVHNFDEARVRRFVPLLVERETKTVCDSRVKSS